MGIILGKFYLPKEPAEQPVFHDYYSSGFVQMQGLGCGTYACLNGGFCTLPSAHVRSTICKCPAGYHGSSCEVTNLIRLLGVGVTSRGGSGNASIGETRDGEDDKVIRFELRPRISGQTGSYTF